MILRAITAFEKTVITVGFAIATVLLFTNVVLRYFFDGGWVWVLETVQYLFAWVVLIGTAYGFNQGIHLGIDVLTSRFSPAAQRLIGLFSVSVCLIFTVTMLVLSIQYTYKVWQWGDLTLDLQIPQWIPYLAIPIGTALMSLHLLEVAVAIWRGELLHVGRTEQQSLQDKVTE